MKKKENTRDAILSSAGQLFAEHGFEAVSTRMIAKEAGIKLGSIHYHFGSKENLYVAAYTAARGELEPSSFSDILSENPELGKTPTGQAEIIRSTIFRRFHESFAKGATWQAKLMVREITNPSPSLPLLIKKLHKPDFEATESFYKLIKPNYDENEAATWAGLFFSQLLFYAVAHESLSLIKDEKIYNNNFLMQAARTLATAMILVVGLPLPEDLR